jgi:hypothetical protein
VSSNNDYLGVEGLKLGVVFDDLPISKLFIKRSDGHFHIARHPLAYQIGSVSDLTVETKNGKVCMIRFNTNDETDISALNKALKHYLINPIDIGPDPQPAKVFQTTKNTSLVILDDATTSTANDKYFIYMYVQQNKATAEAEK